MALREGRGGGCVRGTQRHSDPGSTIRYVSTAHGVGVCTTIRHVCMSVQHMAYGPVSPYAMSVRDTGTYA
eukprot:3315019-Rhodomonas_salina.1